jgi:lauroyl/myristoyl acyltransferase
MMRLQELSSSRLVTQMGILVARHTPRRVGYPLADILGSLIVRRRPRMYQTVCDNLCQILGPGARSDTLHVMARSVFCHALQTYYDFFRAVGQPEEVIAKALRMPDAVIARMRRARAEGRGVLLLGTHMSNFDLAIIGIRAQGFPIQILSLANPRPGFHVLNELRARSGCEVTPITSESLRAAIRRLRGAGMVITGLDRPVPRDGELVECFGRRSYLPLGPVRLALAADAAVFVASCYYESDEGYRVEIAGPIEMVRSGDRQRDMLANARRLAAVLEEQIRVRPEQWMMFHPLWPLQGAQG